MNKIPHPDEIFGEKNKKISREKKRREITPDIPYRETTVLSSVPRLIRNLTEDSTPIDWIWKGYLAKGHVTLLSALWKSGKSTLVGQLLRSIQEGNSFAGQPTFKSKVLILSEESESLWARRNEELGLTFDAWIVCRPLKSKQNRMEWEKSIEEALVFCKENDISTIIIDTLSGFWSARNENDAAEMQEVLLPINGLLNGGLAVLLIHHFRKSGGTEGVASRGSGALGSYADILVEFSRLDKESPHNTNRVLRSYSRFEETPVEVVIEMIDGEYITRGTRAEVGKETRMAFAVKILQENPEGLTGTGILEAWDVELHGRKPVKRTIDRYIKDLLYDDRIQVIGTELKGKKSVTVYGARGVSRRQDKRSTPVSIKKEDTNNKPSSLRQDTYIPYKEGFADKEDIVEIAEEIFDAKAEKLLVSKKRKGNHV